jgi:hypothetical protein
MAWLTGTNLIAVYQVFGNRTKKYYHFNRREKMKDNQQEQHVEKVIIRGISP